MPEPASEILGRRNLGRRRAEAGAHVAGDVGAESILAIEARKHLRDEPETAQRQKRRTSGGQIEVDLLDRSADRPSAPNAACAADTLDVRIDADAGEIGTVRDAQSASRAGTHRADEIAAGRRLRERRVLARARDRPAASARRPRPSAPSARSPAACPTPSRSDASARDRPTAAGRPARRTTRGCGAIRRGRCLRQAQSSRSRAPPPRRRSSRRRSSTDPRDCACARTLH